MNRNPSSFLFFLLCCLVSQSVAQYTFQQRPWQRKARGRPSSSTSYRSTTAQSPPTAVHDYRSHYLDYDDWATDKKTRLWDVRLNSRRPNQMSWTSRLVIANVAMYALQVWKPSVTQLGVKLSDRILRGEELYRLISPVFLHGSIFHLFSNMYSLRNVGQTTEQMFGPGRYLAGYLVAGAAGNLLSAMQSPNPALGASGAVFGVMAGFYVFLNRHDWLLGRQGQAYSDSVTQTLVINMALGAVNPMVDNWGHLGGAIGGAAMAYYFGPRLYHAELPGGGFTIVDRPIVRLPKAIESMPERISDTVTKMTRRMRILGYKADSPSKPWRPKGGQATDYRRRKNAPNQSIKPNF